jgi:regulation of enolase protein 1 (concanavalin A-like superfamily)
MKTANRREFLVKAAGVSCAALWSGPALPKSVAVAGKTAAAENSVVGKALFGRMKWFNEPASSKQAGDQLLVTTKAKTDFWRKTFYEYVTDNGHMFFLPVAGDFTFECRVTGKYAALYDQAGLMVRIDSSNWLKCGLELVDGIGHASVVVTREYSDWSTVRGITTKAALTWRLVRKGSSLEVLYCLDGKNFPLPASVDTGIMCASPEGGGFECTFDEIRLVQ